MHLASARLVCRFAMRAAAGEPPSCPPAPAVVRTCLVCIARPVQVVLVGPCHRIMNDSIGRKGHEVKAHLPLSRSLANYRRPAECRDAHIPATCRLEAREKAQLPRQVVVDLVEKDRND